MTDTVTGVIEQVTKAWSSPDGVKTIFAVRIAGNDTVYKAWGDSGVDMSSMGNEMTLNVQEKDGRDGGKEHWLRSSSAKPFGEGGKVVGPLRPGRRSERSARPSFCPMPRTSLWHPSPPDTSRILSSLLLPWTWWPTNWQPPWIRWQPRWNCSKEGVYKIYA